MLDNLAHGHVTPKVCMQQLEWKGGIEHISIHGYAGRQLHTQNFTQLFLSERRVSAEQQKLMSLPPCGKWQQPLRLR